MGLNKKNDRYAEFRAMSRHEQKSHILFVTELCGDAAPASLARKIEIYLSEPGCDFDCDGCHIHEDDLDIVEPNDYANGHTYDRT